MLQKVAEGVLVHESEFIQSNSVVVPTAAARSEEAGRDAGIAVRRLFEALSRQRVWLRAQAIVGSGPLPLRLLGLARAGGRLRLPGSLGIDTTLLIAHTRSIRLCGPRIPGA
jgi:hypothetical protein